MSTSSSFIVRGVLVGRLARTTAPSLGAAPRRPVRAVTNAILQFVAGWSSIVARPPLRGFRGAVDAAASIGSFSSSSSDGMVVAAVFRPGLPFAPAVAGLPSAPVFAVA
jgi:hypothetical protein